MNAAPETASWSTFSYAAEVSYLRSLDEAADAAHQAFARHPWLVLSSFSGVAVDGFLVDGGKLTVKVKASPSKSPDLVDAEARNVLESAVGKVSQWRALSRDLATEVFVETAQTVASAAAEVGVAVTKSLAPLAVLAVAGVVLYIFVVVRR